MWSSTPNKSQAIRTNPWIQPVNTPQGWLPPALLPCATDSVKAAYPDNSSIFGAVAGLDMDAVEQIEVDLITTLGKSWIAGDTPNQAIRATRDLRPLIGHGNFVAALAQARVLGLA